MDDDVRRELDGLRRRVDELEAMLARLLGTAPTDPLPPERDPFRRPQPPPPGAHPPVMADASPRGVGYDPGRQGQGPDVEDGPREVPSR